MFKEIQTIEARYGYMDYEDACTEYLRRAGVNGKALRTAIAESSRVSFEQAIINFEEKTMGLAFESALWHASVMPEVLGAPSTMATSSYPIVVTSMSRDSPRVPKPMGDVSDHACVLFASGWQVSRQQNVWYPDKAVMALQLDESRRSSRSKAICQRATTSRHILSIRWYHDAGATEGFRKSVCDVQTCEYKISDVPEAWTYIAAFGAGNAVPRHVSLENVGRACVVVSVFVDGVLVTRTLQPGQATVFEPSAATLAATAGDDTKTPVAFSPSGEILPVRDLLKQLKQQRARPFWA